jgi:hypothetical protein
MDRVAKDEDFDQHGDPKYDGDNDETYTKEAGPRYRSQVFRTSEEVKMFWG